MTRIPLFAISLAPGFAIGLAAISGTGAIRAFGHPAQVKKSVSGTGSIHVE